MRLNIIHLLLISFLASCAGKNAKDQQEMTDKSSYHEQHRLQFHFSPKEMWMNDPNGMIYYDGEYHLFYQHYPDKNVWGPMHWGHAISKDLAYWEHLPIALYPDSLGYIFSGSCVIDWENTSGFGKNGEPPMVAIFTHAFLDEQKIPQRQSLAYSLDKGRTWTKYEGNPVIDEGLVAFRDPKVFWHDASGSWIMSIAATIDNAGMRPDHIKFYSSADLKSWEYLSEFGHNVGSQDGKWECPDLLKMKIKGSEEEKWVLLVSINPGGPNGGSGTQYFVGDFDGRKFTAEHNDIRWLDYGPDNYAGVTWSNVEGRKLFIGWMSNWDYAQVVPTEKWRSAMTVPRELGLIQIEGQTYVTSKPVGELNRLHVNKELKAGVVSSGNMALEDPLEIPSSTFDLNFTVDNIPFELKLSNNEGEYALIGYDDDSREFYIDRTKAGKTTFSDSFGKRNFAKRISNSDKIKIRILADVGSIELFADDGEVVMTSLFFPNNDFTHLEMSAERESAFEGFQIREMKAIW